jgi:hypothetical protein
MAVPRRIFEIAAVAFAAAFIGGSAYANHSWSDYHWARTANPFNLIVVNSTTSEWDPYVGQAVADWSASDVLNMLEDASGDTSTQTRRHCNAPNGMVRICNLAYGLNGWLGVAGISVDANDHITRGYTKLNDSYFSTAYYNDPAWKQAVTCQELGHDVGLSHQDENFNNDPLYSCMDYQDPPFEQPNAHDYEELDVIYAQLDSYDTYASSDGTTSTGTGGSCSAPAGKGCNKAGVGNSNADIGWGISLGRHGQQESFLRIDADGTRHYTFVTWARGN